MEQLFGYEQVAKWIVNIRLTFVLFALVSGSVVFAGHRGFFVGGIEGRQRKVASLRAGTPSGDTTRAP